MQHDVNSSLFVLYDNNLSVIIALSWVYSDNDNTNDSDYFGCTDDHDFDLYFNTIFDALSLVYNDNNTNYFDCTSDNDFGLYFDAIFDVISLVYNDNDSDSFGCTCTTNILRLEGLKLLSYSTTHILRLK